MRRVHSVTVTKRDQRVARVIINGLRFFAGPGENDRFEAIVKYLLDVDLGYCLEAAEWEELNGVPWDAGNGIRVLAERGDRQAKWLTAQKRWFNSDHKNRPSRR